MLDDIGRANLFLIGLSAPSLWYRYHHQFQSMLQGKLRERYDAAFIADLHRRASRWLAAQNQAHDAVTYLVAVGAADEAAELLEEQRIPLLNLRRLDELADALALLPAEVVNRRPLLLLAAACVHVHRYEDALATQAIERIDRLLADSQPQESALSHPPFQLELLALRCALDHTMVTAISFAEIQATWQRAAPHLADTCSDVVIAIADRCQRLGQLGFGLRCLTEALDQGWNWPEAAKSQLVTQRAIMHLLDCNFLLAERDCESSLHLGQGGGSTVSAAHVRLMLGTIAGIRHHTDIAEARFIEVLSTPYTNLDTARNAHLALLKLIDLYRYQGRPEAALPYLKRVHDHANSVGLPFLKEHVAAADAYAALACGDLPRAIAWAMGGTRERLDLIMLNSSDRTPILRVRILVAKSSPQSLQRACEILRAYLLFLETQHRPLYLVESKILLALVLARVHNSVAALQTLGEVVLLAVPNGIVGHFILEGRELRELLTLLRRRSRYTYLVDLLLAAYPRQTERQSAATVPAQASSLTARELDVLRLLDEGLTSKEIAARLVISVNTARNHRTSILNKFDAHSSTQAVARARASGMLPPY